MPCRPSTSVNSVRRPSRARPSASAAATVLLPVPPLPVPPCTRAGQPYSRKLTGYLALISQTHQPLFLVVRNSSFVSATLLSAVVTLIGTVTVAELLSCFSTVG